MKEEKKKQARQEELRKQAIEEEIKKQAKELKNARFKPGFKAGGKGMFF